MVNDMRALFYVGLPRRISSVVIASLCIFCSFYLPAVCLSIDGMEPRKFVNELIDHIAEGDSERLIKKFDELEKAFKLSKNLPNESREFLYGWGTVKNDDFGRFTLSKDLVESYKTSWFSPISRSSDPFISPYSIDPLLLVNADAYGFLQLLIQEINARYGSSLTIRDISCIVREDLHILQLPVEEQRLILETIALFEIAPHSSCEEMQHVEKEHKKPKKNSSGFSRIASLHAMGTYLEISKTDKDLPDTVYVGGAEALAGALVFVLGRIYPPAYEVGVTLMFDGVKRVLNGLENMDQKSLPGPNQPLEPFDDNSQE